jgi:Fur family ferric uptake transcriptional regulator
MPTKAIATTTARLKRPDAGVVRHTRQRAAIRAAFESAARPLGPGELLEAARGASPDLGAATVYRAIRSLLDEGWLESVELPGEPARYEIAGKRHHHHFHCRSCGRVFELEGCPDGLERLLPRGFEVSGHEVLLYGRCASCRQRKTRARG